MNLTHPHVITVPIDAIVADRDFWVRAGADPERIAMFADLLAEPGEVVLPWIEVVALGDGRYLLTDGWHRYHAELTLERSSINVQVVDPGAVNPWTFAYLRGLETSATASKPLTRAERRAAVTRLLTEQPDWADVRIARLAGVDKSTVGRIRQRGASPVHVAQSPGDSYLEAKHHTEASRAFAKQLAKMYEAKPLIRGTARLGDSLGQALVDQHGPDEALVWAQRLALWADRAAVVATAAQDQVQP